MSHNRDQGHFRFIYSSSVLDGCAQGTQEVKTLTMAAFVLLHQTRIFWQQVGSSGRSEMLSISEKKRKKMAH